MDVCLDAVPARPLPYWFGAASGLAHGIERHGEQTLHDMFEHWHFFRVLVSDVGTALAKADLEIAEAYSRLAGPLHDLFFPAIGAEHRRCVEPRAHLEPPERAARGV